MKYGELEIWFKPLNGGNFAFCIINRGSQPIHFNSDLKTTIKKYAVDESFMVRDLWLHKDIGTTKENVIATIPSHDVLMLKLTEK
jgi:alpha-galactosidase